MFNSTIQEVLRSFQGLFPIHVETYLFIGIGIKYSCLVVWLEGKAGVLSLTPLF